MTQTSLQKGNVRGQTQVACDFNRVHREGLKEKKTLLNTVETPTTTAADLLGKKNEL
jgi:hypothetical protein